MTHSNVGFKDAILEEQPGGHFKLFEPATHEPLASIVFHNRKAARNWAHGRGLRVLEKQTSTSASFPRPLG